MQGFQIFFFFLHHFVLVKLATSIIRVNSYNSDNNNDNDDMPFLQGILTILGA